MPRYDYKCDTCSHRFEARQSFDSKPVAICPECQNEASRQFHAVPIVFKGSGFYVNDYGKNSSYTGSQTSSNGSSSDSESKAETKSESKAETKSESKAETNTKSETKSTPSKDD